MLAICPVASETIPQPEEDVVTADATEACIFGFRGNKNDLCLAKLFAPPC